jgi:beta-N-acetylhexosaminidase
MQRILLSLIVAAAILGVAFFAYTYQKGWVQTADSTPPVATTTPSASPIPSPTVDLVAEQVAAMTLNQKIGQLMIIGFQYSYVDEHIRTMITRYHIGGVNLLGHNIVNATQTKKLMDDLQALTATTLFLATDQEGGEVTRFKFLKELTIQPKIKTVEQARIVGERRSTELFDLGVNMNFSPVLDYVTSPTSYLYNRTFATTSEAIALLGNAMISGYDAAVIPVAKHFPGYGNIKPDPHKSVAVVTVTAEEFEKFLYPFRYAIDEGNTRAIMTAHIVIPSIDSKPATFSSRFLTDILRTELGFDGIIITDDLEMVSAGKGVDQLAVESIKAGADMIISTYTPSKHVLIFNALKKAVETGEISEERLNESVYRILKEKSFLYGKKEIQI